MRILGNELRKIGLDEDIAAQCDSEIYRMMDNDTIFDDARSAGPIQLQLARNIGRLITASEPKIFGPIQPTAGISIIKEAARRLLWHLDNTPGVKETCDSEWVEQVRKTLPNL